MKKYQRNAALFGFHTFYYLSVELLINDLAEMVIGAQNVVYLYGATCFAVSGGFLLFPLLRSWLGGYRARRVTLFLAWLINIMALACTAWTKAPVMFVFAALLTTISAGFIGGYMFHAIAMNPVDKGTLGRFFAVVYSVAIGFQYLVGWISGLMGERTLFFCVTLYCLCISVVSYVLLFRTRRVNVFAAVRHTPVLAPDIRKYSMVALLIIIILTAMLGLSDGIVTSLHAGQTINVSGVLRLLCIPSTLLAGFLYDYKEEKYFPLLTMICMVVLMLAIFLFNNEADFDIALSILYICWPPATIAATAMLTRVAPATALPDFWVVIGRVAKYTPNGVMAVVGGALFTASSIVPMAILYVILMILLLLLFVSQGKLVILQAQPVAEPPLQPDIGRFGFTKREKEVFDVILQGATVAEMAATLYISEVTVKRHVGSILKKTNLSSRTELLECFGENNRSS